jgi:hypothetical protein
VFLGGIKLKLKLIQYLSIIVIIILFMGCIKNNPNNNDKSRDSSFKSYKISIISNNSNNYTVYVPIAYINQTNPSLIMEKIINDSVKQIETKYGIALHIEHYGNFSLYKELKEFESETLLLSMREIKEINYKPTLFVWIYYNGTEPITLSMELYSEIEEDNIYSMEKEWIENYVIEKNGWIQIQMKAEANVD